MMIFFALNGYKIYYFKKPQVSFGDCLLCLRLLGNIYNTYSEHAHVTLCCGHSLGNMNNLSSKYMFFIGQSLGNLWQCWKWKDLNLGSHTRTGMQCIL